MNQSLQCITLRVVKYNDTNSIATLWSDSLGRISATVPAGKGAGAQRRRAIMQPFAAFEAIAKSRPGRDIMQLADLRPLGTMTDANPVKSVMRLFLADFLYTVLKESAPDQALSRFLFEMVADFDHVSASALPNFHLMFLYRLGYFLGIQPQSDAYAPGMTFDMREARFSITAPTHSLWLDSSLAQAIPILARLNTRNLALWRLDRQQRNQVLDHILQYYSLHYAPVATLSSLQVVRDVFS